MRSAAASVLAAASSGHKSSFCKKYCCAAIISRSLMRMRSSRCSRHRSSAVCPTKGAPSVFDNEAGLILTILPASSERRIVGAVNRLYAPDAYFGQCRFHCRDDAGDKTAAADTHDDVCHLRAVLHDFQRDYAIARDLRPDCRRGGGRCVPARPIRRRGQRPLSHRAAIRPSRHSPGLRLSSFAARFLAYRRLHRRLIRRCNRRPHGRNYRR